MKGGKPWFRFYAKVLDCAKIQTLTPALFHHWVNILCIAAETGGSGRLPKVPQIAFRLRVNVDDVDPILEQLQLAGLLEQVRAEWRVHDWKDWQYESDLSSDRVRKYRKTQENGNGHETEYETKVKRPPSVSVSDSVSESEFSLTSEEENHVRKNGRPRKKERKPHWTDPYFETFWAECVWAKIGIDDARNSYQTKAKNKEIAERINAAAKAQGPDIVRHAEQHHHSVLHPATWLNQGRYDDAGVVVKAREEMF